MPVTRNTVSVATWLSRDEADTIRSRAASEDRSVAAEVRRALRSHYLPKREQRQDHHNPDAAQKGDYGAQDER